MTLEYSISNLNFAIYDMEDFLYEIKNGYDLYKSTKQYMSDGAVKYQESCLKDLKDINIRLQKIAKEVNEFVDTVEEA